MAIADKLNDLITQRNNLADNLNTMGVSASQDETLTTLVPKVLEIQTGGGSEITKGVIVNECDSDGYVTDAEIVGMTTIPNNYFRQYNSITLSYLGKIEKLKIPNSLTSIGQYAFYGCSKLALTSLPNSLTSIDMYAFGSCSNLALTNLPDSLTVIRDQSFYGCTNLTLEKSPTNLTSIGTEAFRDCTNLKLTSLPEGLTNISQSAFYNCTNLPLTSLPNSLTSIGQHAFYKCSKLALTSLPSGIKTIPNYAFHSCASLTSLEILGKITSIGNNAFINCTLLEKIVLPNITSVPTLSNNVVFNGTPIANKTGYIYVPDDLVTSFQSATNWSTYASQIKGVSEL